jgi:hypothetical protein
MTGRWVVRLVCTLGLLCCAAGPASAVTLDVSAIEGAALSDTYIQEHLTFAQEYLSVRYDLGIREERVTLSVLSDPDATVVFRKDYGVVSGVFISDEIYLSYPAQGPGVYQVTLTAGDNAIVFPFRRKLLRLTGNTACSGGVRFADMASRFAGETAMGTAVSLQRDNTVSVPLVASGMYVAGQVHVSVREGSLTVTCAVDGKAAASVRDTHIYLLTDLGELADLSERFLRLLPSCESGYPVDIASRLNGADVVIVYVKMELDYDPNALERFVYRPDSIQMDWIRQMENNRDLPAVGRPGGRAERRC